MIILGIDPALNKTGWGVISFNSFGLRYIDKGIIAVEVSNNLVSKLGTIVIKLESIINKFNPDYVSMEEVFVNKNFRSSLSLAHARGAVLSVMGRLGIDVIEYAPNKVKKSVTGTGFADKIQMQKMVRLLMSVPDDISEDEADALAVAYTASVHLKLL